jgi:hypothetical protein
VKLAGTKFRLGPEFILRNVNEIRLDGAVSVLAFIPEAEHAAIAAGTSTYDCASAIAAAHAATKQTSTQPCRTLFWPGGIYRASNVVVDGRFDWRGVGAQSELRALDSGDDHYFVASASYLATGATSVDAPFVIRGMAINAGGYKDHAFVCRAYYPIINECYFYGATNTDFLVSTSGRDGTQVTGSMVNGRLNQCWFGYDAGTAQYNFRSIDPNFKATDWIVTESYFSSASVANFDVRHLAGWIITGNHFYGADESAILRRIDYATIVQGNYFDVGNVEITDGQSGYANSVFGPGNVFNDGILRASFGVNGPNIISKGNTYTEGYILHNYNDVSKKLLSIGDTFNNANPAKWSSGSSAGVIQFDGSFNAYIGQLMYGAFNASTAGGADGVGVLGTHGIGVLNSRPAYVAKAGIYAANAFTMTATVPALAADNVYEIELSMSARDGHTGTLRLAYSMKGVAIYKSGTDSYGLVVTDETITGAQFSSAPAFTLTKVGNTTTVTCTATFADVETVGAYGGAVLRVI